VPEIFIGRTWNEKLALIRHRKVGRFMARITGITDDISHM